MMLLVESKNTKFEEKYVCSECHKITKVKRGILPPKACPYCGRAKLYNLEVVAECDEKF